MLAAAGTDVDKLNVFMPTAWSAKRYLAAHRADGRRNSETPALKAKYGAKAESYLKMSEEMFEKIRQARLVARDQGRRLHEHGLAAVWN